MRVRGVRRPETRAARLRQELCEAGYGPGLDARIAAALAATTEARQEIRAVRERRDRSRESLEGYRDLARNAGFGEDIILDVRYRQAYALLYRTRCELDEADAAVLRYAEELRAKMGGAR